MLAILGSEKFLTSRHLWDVPISVWTDMAKIVWLAELAFLVTGCLVKISVLLFYRRLVRDTFSPAWRWAVISAISFTVAYTLAFILALVFNCSPTEAYWKGFDPDYHRDYSCANTTIINSLSGVMGIVGDLYSVALPCIMTRNLMLPFAQKIGLYIVFGLGLLVTGASCMRTYYLHELGSTSDVSWTVYTTFVWAQLELALSLMCASAPALRVLFREYFSEPIIKAKRSVMSSKSRKRSEVEISMMKQDAASRETLRCNAASKHVMVTSTFDRENDDDIALTRTESREVKASADYEIFSLQTTEMYRQSSQLILSYDWPKGRDGKHSWLQTREGRRML